MYVGFTLCTLYVGWRVVTMTQLAPLSVVVQALSLLENYFLLYCLSAGLNTVVLSRFCAFFITFLYIYIHKRECEAL